MSRDEEEFDPADAEFEDYVPAMVARSLAEAERYRDLLSDHDIPSQVGEEELAEEDRLQGSTRGMSRGVAVLVPEVLLDEASEIIADSENDEDLRELDEDEEFADEEEEDELEGFGEEEDLGGETGGQFGGFGEEEEDEELFGGFDDDDDEMDFDEEDED